MTCDITMTPPTTQNGPLRHFLQFKDFSSAEIAYVLDRARLIKDKFKRYEPHMPLHDRTLAMVFEKASTRTRVSFEAGMYQMGGSVINLTSNDSQLGRSEPIEDTARVISRMVDIVMIRTFEQTRIERFASHSRVPVINGLTNEFHPCQILADIFTYIEHRGSIAGKTVAWVATPTTWPTPGCTPRDAGVHAARVHAGRLRAGGRSHRQPVRQGAAPVQGPDGSLQGRPSRHHRRLDQHGL